MDVSGDAERGHVDLGQFFHTSGMVCAYTFAEIDSPEAAEAKLFTGSDDQIAVWLNGSKIYDFGGNSVSGQFVCRLQRLLHHSRPGHDGQVRAVAADAVDLGGRGDGGVRRLRAAPIS